jgi:hypothetical protein
MDGNATGHKNQAVYNAVVPDATPGREDPDPITRLNLHARKISWNMHRHVSSFLIIFQGHEERQ